MTTASTAEKSTPSFAALWLSDNSQREAHQMMEFHGLPLIFWQPLQGLGQSDQPFVARGVLTRRRLIHRQPGLDPR